LSERGERALDNLPKRGLERKGGLKVQEQGTGKGEKKITLQKAIIIMKSKLRKDVIEGRKEKIRILPSLEQGKGTAEKGVLKRNRQEEGFRHANVLMREGRCYSKGNDEESCKKEPSYDSRYKRR